ncbi:hypothetical protein Tco_0434749 [Tanacetum coccineum]
MRFEANPLRREVEGRGERLDASAWGCAVVDKILNWIGFLWRDFPPLVRSDFRSSEVVDVGVRDRRVGDNGGDKSVGWRWCKTMVGGVGGGSGGIGVWVWLVLATMVGGDVALVVCGGGGGCRWWFAAMVGWAGGRGGVFFFPLITTISLASPAMPLISLLPPFMVGGVGGRLVMLVSLGGRLFELMPMGLSRFRYLLAVFALDKLQVKQENVDILIKPSTEDTTVFINVAVALTIMEKCFVPIVDTRTCDGVKNTTSLGSEHRFVSHGSDLNSGRWYTHLLLFFEVLYETAFDRPSLDHYLAGLADRPRTRFSIPQIKFVCGNKHRSEEEGLTSHEASP